MKIKELNHKLDDFNKVVISKNLSLEQHYKINTIFNLNLEKYFKNNTIPSRIDWETNIGGNTLFSKELNKAFKNICLELNQFSQEELALIKTKNSWGDYNKTKLIINSINSCQKLIENYEELILALKEQKRGLEQLLPKP